MLKLSIRFGMGIICVGMGNTISYFNLQNFDIRDMRENSREGACVNA